VRHKPLLQRRHRSSPRAVTRSQMTALVHSKH
jgi:hypothetical protein